jgi:ankyrin repeat protein
LQLIQIFDLKNKDFKILTSKEDQKKWTPIYYAIDVSESGFPDIVGKRINILIFILNFFSDLLLKNGAEANKQDDKGITALHLAAYKGQDDNVEILLKHKANPNIRDISGSKNLEFLKY